MADFTKAARLADLPPGTCRMVEVSGKQVAVVNAGGALHALDDVCPHAGGPLSEGSVGEGKVTCPWHGWQFDLKTGAHCGKAQAKVRTYAVKSDGEDVLIEV